MTKGNVSLFGIAFIVLCLAVGCTSLKNMVDSSQCGVQLWKDGPYWAECNVGATKPEDCGYYFCWGDTVGYTCQGGSKMTSYSSEVTWISRAGTGWGGSTPPFLSVQSSTYGKDVAALQTLRFIDPVGNLVPAHDAATAHLGSSWRMPTAAEWNALMSNCTVEWVTTNGVSGQRVTGIGAYASKSIFLPASGFAVGSSLYSVGMYGSYWSSTPSSGDHNSAFELDFYPSTFAGRNYARYIGQSVRAVRGPRN